MNLIEFENEVLSIKAKREAAGLSKRELGRRVGVSSPTIKNAEEDPYSVRLGIILMILEKLE